MKYSYLIYLFPFQSEPLRLFFKITQDSPEKTPSETAITPFSPSTSTISSSMAATPASHHPSPPSSPQMAQEPNDIRVQEPNDIKVQVPNPAAMKSGQGSGVIGAVSPHPNGMRVRKAVPATGQSGSDAKIKNAGAQEPNKHSVDSRNDLLNVPAVIIPKVSGRVNGVLADRTVSDANLKGTSKKFVDNVATLLMSGNALGQEDEFVRMSATPKLKSALKKGASDSVASSPIKVDAQRRFSMDSQLSTGHVPLSNGHKSKKRVTFSVNLVQDSQGLKRKVPDYFEDRSPFKIDPVKGSAIGGMVHLRKKVLSHKSS